MSPAGVSTYDLPTLDKIPVIRRLMQPDRDGLALDIGVGTGYTTSRVFEGHRTVCLDLHAPNLDYYRRSTAAKPGVEPPRCVVAAATSLPFRDGSFRYVLLSEVLEHLQDEDVAAAEIARVLADDGLAVITVPYVGIGFVGFLELCGIKTVHDYPGPEYHVRPGYDERSLATLLARHGLEIEQTAFYLRFFTKAVVDMVSLAHLTYQRIVHHRRSWTWSEAAESEDGLALQTYARIFPLLRAVSRLDGLLSSRRGFGLVASVRKTAVSSAAKPVAA